MWKTAHATTHACMTGDYDIAAGIIFDNRLHEDLDRWGNSRTLIELYEMLLPERLDEEPKLTSIQTHGTILGHLGLAYYCLGQVERAIGYYEQTLTIAQEISGKRGESNSLENVGIANSNLNEAGRAIGYFEQALRVAQDIGDKAGEYTSLNNSGMVF
jgi:tetratricopeptide (TPR) repeat protein